jgi:hypothetical protein
MSELSASTGVSVVLVHGGFVDGSGWEGVYQILKKNGHRVAVVQNATASLADDVAAMKRATTRGSPRSCTSPHSRQIKANRCRS